MIVRLEIEDELMDQAESSAKAQGVSFDEFVKQALRGAVAQTKFTVPKIFEQKVHDFGVDVESPWSVLADLETNAAVMMRK